MNQLATLELHIATVLNAIHPRLGASYLRVATTSNAVKSPSLP